MARDIPGFYYDEAKKKYFKIEASTTAPQNSAWSADSVKRRKLEDARAHEAQRLLDRRKAVIQHSVALTEPLTGGFLRRELGLQAEEDLSAACWARGLREKGYVSLRFSTEPTSSPNIPLFYISNHDRKTGLGVAYGTLDEENLIGSYIPRDENDRVKYNADARLRPERLFQPRPEVRVPQISSIAYQERSHHILLTSRELTARGGIWFFSPKLSDRNDDGPSWLLGESSLYQHMTVPSTRGSMAVLTCTPAPAPLNMVCAIGTSEGILAMHDESTLTRLTPSAAPTPKATIRPHQHSYQHGRGRGGSSSSHSAAAAAEEIFAIDFLTANPNVLVAGGRSGHVWLADTRLPAERWASLRHRSAVAHVRSVGSVGGGHGILAAGVRSTMALYDLRFCPGGLGGATATSVTTASIIGSSGNWTKPLLTFPAYRNEAYLHIGLDVEASPGYGVVAAAHDDGAVALYSLRTGARLRGGAALDGLVAEAGPVRKLQFCRLPGDEHPSLFVGRGARIEKYSFGVLEGGLEE